MFFLNESFTNKRFQTDLMTNCTTLAPETTLEVSNKAVTFQKTYQANFNHTFQCFTKATSMSNWAVMRWISIILLVLGMGIIMACFQLVGNLPLTQTSLNAWRRKANEHDGSFFRNS